MRKNKMIISMTFIRRGAPYTFGYHSYKTGFLKGEAQGLPESTSRMIPGSRREGDVLNQTSG
ncbi:MAG: hypothetical protein R6V01_03000 [Thermoplasmatota archaeon]